MEQKTTKVISSEVTLPISDPSPDTKKYKSILHQDFLIIFPHYTSYKKNPQIQVFSLSTDIWSTTTLRNAPPILEHSEGYSLSRSGEDSFILFGGYKVYISQGGGGLFGPPPKIVSEVCLGIIIVRIVDEKVELFYRKKNEEGAPFLSHHSASCSDFKLWVFGGKNAQEECMNSLFCCRIDDMMGGPDGWESPLKSSNMFSVALKPSARCRHENLMYKDCLYVFGGIGPSGDILDDLWCLDQNLLSWRKVSTSLRTYESQGNCKNIISSSVVSENYLIFGSENPSLHTTDFYVFAIDGRNNAQAAQSSKTTISSDGYTHCLEVYEDQIIFGNSSNLYSLHLSESISSPVKAPPTKNAQEFPMSIQASQTQTRIIPETYEEQQRRHFEERLFPDITFKVQGTDIKAHKGFLAIRCPYFHRMFSSGMIEAKSKEIEITDITPATFNIMLEWIYCDQVKKMEDQIAQELFAVADKFSLPDLKKLAEKCLIEHLAVENVVERAELADIFEASNLEKAAVKFIVTNIDAVFEKSDIRKLPDSILLKVIKGGK